VLTPVLIDDRISCDFLISDTVDNVIYCSGIEESLYDINTFTTKGGEFIHQYITESSGDRSVILNVTLPDGTILENIKFKVIVSDSIDLPYSTIRYSIDDTVNTLIQENNEIAALPQIDTDSLNDDIEPIVEQVEDVPVVQDIDESVFVERAKLLEAKIINEQELVEQQKELIKQKEEMVESHRNLLNSLDFYKEQLDLQLRSLYEQNTKQFFDDKKKQFNESIKQIDERINKLIKEKKDFDALNQQNKQYTDTQVARASKESREFAKRILDLGGGGGSVAQQFANGGTMNGDLNVTGQYLSGGVSLFNILSGSGGGQGNPAVNALVISTSANWNSAYASTTALNLSSSSWNSSFTTLCANSATWVKFQPNPDIPTDATAVALTVNNSSYYNGIYNKNSSTNYSIPYSFIDINFNGSIWELRDDGTIIYSSSDGPAYPWLATWTTITVTRNNLDQVVGQPLASTGSTGTSQYAARADHIHPFPTAQEVGSPLLFSDINSILPNLGDNGLNSSPRYSMISSGYQNCLGGTGSADYSVIAGGYQNNLREGSYSTIGGGIANSLEGDCSTIGGGGFNCACSSATVGGGGYNTASGYQSAILGGRTNIACGKNSTVGGGECNNATGGASTITGGAGNTANALGSVANGIGANTCGGAWVDYLACWYVAPTPIGSGNYSVVGGGFQNNSGGSFSVVGGGCCNKATGCYSVVAGGRSNTASGNYSFIAGGSANDTKGFTNTFILGSSLSASQPNYTYVNNLSSKGLIAAACVVINQAPTTFTNPVTASGTFLIVNVNGTNQAIQLWNYSS
jgi:hypothetical protein